MKLLVVQNFTEPSSQIPGKRKEAAAYIRIDSEQRSQSQNGIRVRTLVDLYLE